GFGATVAEPELRLDLDLGPLEGLPDRVEVDLDAGAAGEDIQAADAQPEAIDRQLGAAVAQGTDDPAPVGIAAMDCRLDQAGRRHRAGGEARLGVVGGAVDADC